jgi:hypothetical protein
MHFRVEIHNEQGYVFATVLIVLVLLSTLVGLVMMGIITQNRFVQRDVDSLKARYHAEAAIWKFLWDDEMWSRTDQSHFTFITTDSQEVTVNRRAHGGYWVVISEAAVGKSQKKIVALVGEKGGEIFNKAIVLGDIRTPLTLTGSSILNGNIQTGPEGVQYRPFKGELFSGSFIGNVSTADSSALPRFNTEQVNLELKYYRSLIDSIPTKSTLLKSTYINELYLNDIEPDKKIFFKDGDLTIDSTDPVQLPDSSTWIATGNMSIRGKIDTGKFTQFITSDTMNVDAEMNGEHALFYSGKSMSIRGESVLSGQFFSEGEIDLSGNMYLTYPSLIYTKPALKGPVKTGKIVLRDRVILDGVVMLPDLEKGLATDDQSIITIGEEVIVRGALYNTSRSELHGTVHGTVMTNQFYFYISPTTYLNWLKDAGIDLFRRPAPFSVPIGFSSNKQFEIIYWEEMKTDYVKSDNQDPGEL